MKEFLVDMRNLL